MTKPFHITIFDSFDSIAQQWNNFENHANNYAFQNYYWLKTWFETMGSRTIVELCLTQIEYPQGQPLMLLPLGLEKRHGFLCLTWLGGQVSDYHGPLMSADCTEKLSQELFLSVWQELNQKLPAFDVISFEKMPEVISDHRNPFTYLPCIAHASSAHWVDLGDNFDNFINTTISKKNIKWTKKQRRHLEEHGKVEFLVASDPEQIEQILTTMIAQKSQSYQELGVANLFAMPGVCDFFNTISATHSQDHLIHLSALLLDGKIIATHWGLFYKKRFYCLYPAYARDNVSKYAPGTQLLWHLFSWCIDNGAEIFDFTIGDEPYKDKWCKTKSNVFDYYHSATLKGYLYVWPLSMAKKIKRTIKHTPSLWKLALTLRVGFRYLRNIA